MDHKNISKPLASWLSFIGEQFNLYESKAGIVSVLNIILILLLMLNETVFYYIDEFQGTKKYSDTSV